MGHMPKSNMVDVANHAGTTSTGTSNVVEVVGLTKKYGHRTAVDHLDLVVETGRVIGLIGANGAGKTTTVECIQGIRRPDDGAVRVMGLDPFVHRNQLRALVGCQLQDSGLPDRLKVSEAVALFSAHGAKNDALLERFGLSTHSSSAFASLSGGERQRLFIVLALVNHPRLVVLDELTQNLDPAARRNVWEAVEELRAEGITVLLVTHELDEAERLCDRVIAMRDGRVLASGSPADLVDRFGPRATISFTAADELGALEFPERLGHLPGVTSVQSSGRRVEVQGERPAIAYVGAALAQAGWVPPDLNVRVPSLEDALINLLEDGCPARSASSAARPGSRPARSAHSTVRGFGARGGRAA